MRKLTFAMATSAPIDLLILDEPTNNLDIETVEVIEDALNNFKGAVIIISHNIDFLNAIGISQAFCISEKKLVKMHASPVKTEEFHRELMKLL